jgi:hypothetical protein
MNSGTNLIRSAATGMNNTFIRPAASGIKMTATGMNDMLLVPVTDGIKTVAMGMNNTFVEPLAKLARVSVAAKDAGSEAVKTNDDQSSGSELSEIEEEEEEELPPPPPPESAFQYLIVDGAVDAKALSTALHEMYSAHVAGAQDIHEENQADSAIGTVLEASSLLVDEFSLLNADQEVLETVQEAMDDYIFPRISLMYTEVSTLRASDVAKIITFADLYSDTLLEKNLIVPKERLAHFEELATEYLKRAVHNQMKTMIGSSLRLRNEEDLRINEDGKIVTGNPEDVSYMMKMQLTVAKENLPPRFLSHVLAACNSEIINMAGDIAIGIGSNWKHQEIEHICAVVNDTASLIEQCEELNETILDPNNNEHVKAGDELLKTLTELSLHAVRFVCERIMLDLREPDPLLTRIGTAMWEQGSDVPIIGCTVKTLDSYFRDIELWIPQGYYFPKVVKHCLDMTLQAYVDSFFVNTMVKGIKDPLVVSRELQQDWQELNAFFCLKEDQADYLGHAGHYSKDEASSHIDIIQALSFLMTPSITPSKLQPEINKMLHQFGTEAGITALLHIAGLRNRHISASEAAEWHEVAKEAVEELVDEDAFKIKPVFSLPDLRASKYIARVRAANEELDDSLRSAGLDNLPPRAAGLRKRWGASFRASGRRLMKSDRTLLTTWKQKGETPGVDDDKTAATANSECNPDETKSVSHL